MFIVTLILSTLVLFALLTLFFPLMFKQDSSENVKSKTEVSSDYSDRIRVLNELHADLNLEHESGKISDEDYTEEKKIILQKIEEAKTYFESTSLASHVQKNKNFARPNRIGMFCPECGNLNHRTKDGELPLYCVQCGFYFSPMDMHGKHSTSKRVEQH